MTNSSKRPDATARNIFGEPLAACCFNPLTGYFRDGYCRTDRMDLGVHVVCARVTDEFLSYSKSRGNDLITARPEFNFPGLTDGDFWCLCAQRWYEAVAAGVAPKIKLEATHERVLQIIPLEILKEYAI